MTAKLKNAIPAVLSLAFLFSACKKPDVMQNVPALDKVSGIWVSADTIAMEPSIRNFRGQAVLNRDATSISWFVSAPYSGGYHTGVMKINGEVPLVSMFRWQPYQASRICDLKDWKISSATRMLPDENGIMWEVEITNTTNEAKDLHIDLDLIGFISKYEGDWQWWYPYPKMTGRFTTRDDEVENVRKNIGKSSTGPANLVEELVNGKPTGKKVAIKWPDDKEILACKKYNATVEDQGIFVSDTETDAVTVFEFATQPDTLVSFNSGGHAVWNAKMQPGEKKTIRYFMAYGDNREDLKKTASAWKDNFDSKFNHVWEIWETRWKQLFVPGDTLLSGCFPVLETRDTLAKKVYYTGPLTLLYLTHTNLPQHKKVYLTGGPKWGASITFFWDITEWSTMLAVADPAFMKEHIKTWITIDPSKFYGVDNFGGKGVGNAYSANYWAIFQLIRSYITVTGDYDFLNETVNGKTVLETLEHYATNWERISLYGQPGCTDDIYKLADFGDDEWNLLECVPTYKHIVPSFNAGYIWMMREVSAFYKKTGNTAKADSLRKKADDMLPRLMKLYAGNGIWNSLYPGQKYVEVRHCLDFMFMGRFLPNDIPDSMKTEMLHFLDTELMTNHWMRAQSLSDVAAKNSDRPDHGPLGAYDGWPAGTMDALVQMGYSQKALDFYHAIEPVTYEGSWAQAHELWGDNKENKNARTRIAERGWHARDAMAGVGMSQVMLKCFFGFYPDAEGNPIFNQQDAINFQGTLHHVLFKGTYYSITLNNGKRVMTKE
jgi:hypothetical protein